MAAVEKVTVDKSYFDALLRRADFHTLAQNNGRPDPVNIQISRVEYDSLLRTSREFELLKNALFRGGITAETLDLLVAGTESAEHRKDSGSKPVAWADDFVDQVPYHDRTPAAYTGMHWRPQGPAATFNLAPGSGPYHTDPGQSRPGAANLKVPGFSRHASFGVPPSSMPDEGAFDDAGSIPDEGITLPVGPHSHQDRRTLYFAGLSDRATYKDLLSVIKGGKLLSVNMRGERSATVTFLDGAADFLAWAKKNDIYLNSKRIEVRWAERQYRLNGHIQNKIMNGATRNMVVHNALPNGLTESRIRDDMEHIHNLIIISVTYRNGDAYISTNSVHNALFARTCMMSRTTYKGCKVEFVRDECDVPLPAPVYKPRALPSQPSKKNAPLANRFDLINMDGNENSSDEENQEPVDSASDDDATVDLRGQMGVSLNFLDSEST